jgi:hypothetical protein
MAGVNSMSMTTGPRWQKRQVGDFVAFAVEAEELRFRQGYGDRASCAVDDVPEPVSAAGVPRLDRPEVEPVRNGGVAGLFL